MYVPASFKIIEQSEVLALMKAHPFAALISHDAEGLTATHVPTVTRLEGETLVAECHLARPNPHWKRLAANPDAEAMMIFSGPDAYIRPGWYPSKAEGGKTVPTWNYATVHAYGRVEVIQEGAWLLRHVTELSEQQESPYEMPWKTSDAPEQYIAALIRGIVGVRLSVSRVDAKAKMGQNRDRRDIRGAADGLAARAQRSDLAVSAMMRAARS
ncbi:FMN-binding negative transcriptional regulator [Dongia deserti]|uniref:FMN-binding negative transcriptional regulator n=1 Tax=Dongia deserti TaxID=2268030 RepID=UPI000E653E2D|nr:FMN-binding negative transcriptional regulator [Dongia deserti]